MTSVRNFACHIRLFQGLFALAIHSVAESELMSPIKSRTKPDAVIFMFLIFNWDCHEYVASYVDFVGPFLPRYTSWLSSKWLGRESRTFRVEIINKKKNGIVSKRSCCVHRAYLYGAPQSTCNVLIEMCVRIRAFIWSGSIYVGCRVHSAGNESANFLLVSFVC